MTTTRTGERVQRWYCSDCQCEHEASVIGGVLVPPLESPPLQSLKEVESTRSEEEDYDSGIGGDEPFCEHGNLLWSETCDECIEAHWKLMEQFND